MNQNGEFLVGLPSRRTFRRRLRSLGVEFTEDAGWFDSQFIVSAPYETLVGLHQLVARANTSWPFPTRP